ncbi:MAG: hypothetical protein ACAI44_25430 [Candidatus Sericytochromatia bacterium]
MNSRNQTRIGARPDTSLKLSLRLKLLIAGSLSLSLLACSQSAPLLVPRTSQTAVRPALPKSEATPPDPKSWSSQARILASPDSERLQLHLRLPTGFHTQLAGTGQLAFVKIEVRGQGIGSSRTHTGPEYLPAAGEISATVDNIPRSDGQLRVIILRGYDADLNELEAFELRGYYRSDSGVYELSASLGRRELLLGRVLQLLLVSNPGVLSTLDLDALQSAIDQATGYAPAGRRLFTTDPGRFDATALAALIPAGGSPLPNAAAIIANALPGLQTVSLDLETPKGRPFGEAVTVSVDDPGSRPSVLAAGEDSGSSVSVSGVPRGNWNLRVHGGDGELLTQTRVSVSGSGVSLDDDPLTVSGVQEQLIPVQVNSFTTGNQEIPRVAMDADGDFVVTWESQQDGDNYGIYAQRFDSDGVPVGPEFQVNQWTTNDQENPSVAMDAQGNFTIAWQSRDQDGDQHGVYARRYASDGTALGNEFQVNTLTALSQWIPLIAMDNDGDFVISWLGRDGSLYGIHARRYDSAGTALDPVEFQANTITNGFQWMHSLAMDGDGDFVITWQSSGSDIHARCYASNGNPVTASEFRVNTFITGSQAIPSVGMDTDGDFVIAWTSANQDGDQEGIFAQRFSAGGTPAGVEFQVNAITSGKQIHSSVAMDPDGDFTVLYEDYYYSIETSEFLSKLYIQRFNADGSPSDDERQVGEEGYSIFGAKTIARNGTGTTITWHDLEFDGNGYGIYMMRYDADGNPL